MPTCCSLNECKVQLEFSSVFMLLLFVYIQLESDTIFKTWEWQETLKDTLSLCRNRNDKFQRTCMNIDIDHKVHSDNACN
jgi:hypothetical protein